MQADIESIKLSLSKVETDIAEMKTDMAVMKLVLSRVETDIAEMKKDIAKIASEQSKFKDNIYKWGVALAIGTIVATSSIISAVVILVN